MAILYLAATAFTLTVPLQASDQAQLKPSSPQHSINWQAERNHMIDVMIAEHGCSDKRVLAAMRSVPRHLFVPAAQAELAYKIGNIQIGEGQVIGHPYVQAFMIQSLKLNPTDKVLEIGTGSGYETAVLSQLASQVYSIEIRPSLERAARERLAKMGYKNVHVKLGDGYKGWAEQAPFDAIVVTAVPAHPSQTLINQLKQGGRMIVPDRFSFKLMTQTAHGILTESLKPEWPKYLPASKY